MLRSVFWKVVFAFILAVVLAAPAARAAEPRSRLETAAGASISWGLLEQAWNILARIWAENGCVADPDGLCQPDPGTSSITSDNGCVIDPNGRCIG